MNSKPRCCRGCRVTTVYCFSLRQGVVFVGISTTIISLIAMITSATCLEDNTGTGVLYNNHPVVAIIFLFSLYFLCMSVYQIVISVLLARQALQTKGDMFLCWLWYVSHLSVLLFSFMFFTAKTIICLNQKETFMAILTLTAGVIYEGVIIYFLIIVNSFINMIDDDVYY